ncbi:L-erythro-3,5-diaminohexanoate dehydrogenase [Hornefia butyriciproducens]|uniref:L-erythro-3,5-diaminohexanoate dehydrogenase n=1 Tax=Hornefia butyriciproducens TaxID=2652293 RepID=UPI003F8B79BC
MKTREKGEYYGTHRVIKPEGLLPQAAEKIDNSLPIYSNEILIDVIALQPTATAMHTIKTECGEDETKVKERILQIVEDRGKFQDPITKSGGMLIGTVKEIGDDLKKKGTLNLKVGDKIATLVSLSLTPLQIRQINKIDLQNEQVWCDAYAILFESGIYTKIPDDLGEELSLAVMDIAGAPASIAKNAREGDIIVVMGAGKAGLLSLAEAKKRVAPTGKVICMEYSKAQCELVRKLKLADIVLCVDGQKPLEVFNKYIEATSGRLADLTVSTVNVPDTELSTILVTKDTGRLFFYSMSTDFCKASLGCEGVKKYPTMILGSGYCPGHAEIAFNIVRENDSLRKYLVERYCV